MHTRVGKRGGRVEPAPTAVVTGLIGAITKVAVDVLQSEKQHLRTHRGQLGTCLFCSRFFSLLTLPLPGKERTLKTLNSTAKQLTKPIWWVKLNRKLIIRL